MVDRTFIDELASKAPTPGGGGASAYVGALATALASMVANLTVGKKKYAEVEDLMEDELVKLFDLRDRFLDLIDEDARAFAPLARAYGLPKQTPEEKALQQEALQEALIGACEVPLEIMDACLEALKSIETMARFGSRLALSDAGVAAVFAKAALQGASLNVFINIDLMADEALAQRYDQRARDLLAVGCAKADEIFDSVLKGITHG